jgi:hypothetical protein
MGQLGGCHPDDKNSPGEQFVIRREVFRMMKEQFVKHGIEFANHDVTVYLPPVEENKADAKKIAEAGAAAAAAAEKPNS